MTLQTPWGSAQSDRIVRRGIHVVSTAGHGGVMISVGLAKKILSAAAQKRGEVYGGYLCYEEDCDCLMPLLELPELRGSNTTDEGLIKSLSLWHPEYLIERGIEPVEPQYTMFKNRATSWAMREQKHPDLIVSALRMDDQVTKVVTADDKRHFVKAESYDCTRDLNLLSLCELVENYTQTTSLWF